MHVLTIESHPIWVADIISSRYLPQSRNSRADGGIAVEIGTVILHFRLYDGPRPDDAHFALQNVPELRHLIKTELAHDRACSRNTGIVSELSIRFPLGLCLRIKCQIRGQDRFGVRHHGAEFHNLKGNSVRPKPALPEEQWPARLSLHSDSARKQDR